MRRYIAALAAAAIVGAGAIDARSYKRGVSENQFSITQEMTPLAPGVSWYYNWGNVPGGNIRDFDGFEFIPMCWNSSYNVDNIRKYCKEHPEVKYILGFNEPNFTNQANMTPAAAAQKWPAVVELARELGLKIVAPALNYSPNAPYQSPTKWFDEFVALVGKDSFDYVAIHGYGGFGVIKTLATEFHERYGKDVWVTEFCYWPGESGHVAPDTQISSMVETVTWLETTPWIYRYAWFKAKGAYNSNSAPNYGLIISKTGYDERELSPQGKVYVYMSEFDSEIWNAVGTAVNAVDYINADKLALGEGANAACGKPIEISRFNAGSYADYQFDVPEAGDYRLVLTVTGEGEPVRFDPTLQVQTVKDGNATAVSASKQFTLPGNNTDYVEREIPVTLAAGRQTLRIADMAPYTPSGIRISTVTLRSAGSGVDDIAVDGDNITVNVYTLQGIMVRENVPASEATAGLPAGIYVAGGRKIVVK
ncbi:MAG: glycosyl hydrolase [Bacteroidales bacterium]|nr:glycosyl hydrolase [Bacteroidales bacterium]